MTDEKIRSAVEIAQKAIDLAHRVPPEGLRKSKELMTLAHAVVELSAELAALKDKARWRKQSEEPAPEGKDIEAYSSIRGYVFYRAPSDSLLPHWYWRPLDLPEEDAK